MKRKESDAATEDDADASKAAKVLESDGEESSASSDMEIEEAAVAEVMRWLELEISRPPEPPPHGDGFYAGARFVTINGNEESCGPSFSDAASTVMASIDTRGVVGVSFFYGEGQPSTMPAIRPQIWPAAAPASAIDAVGEEDEWAALELLEEGLFS